MELAFNEISQTPLLGDKFNANARMVQFSEAVAEARRKGFVNIRSHNPTSEIRLTNDYTFRDWMFDRNFPAVHRELFYDMFIQPFIKEDDVEVEEKYIEANYYFEDTENKIPKQECLGLTSAYLCETLAISFQSSPAWLKNMLGIIIEKEEHNTTEDVHHVYSRDCFIKNSIADFVESITILNLIETNINPNDKHFHLTSHHGQQELNELWSRVKNSPYVIEGISIEWGGNSFYKKPQRDGKVNIVHLKSDRRYAIQIQTTGTNLRETIEIAKRIEEQYG
ncbi:MAG TPA: hypothetical protein DDX39_03060 [Bacteroidales bacterium]|nr:MAG: hypothetical protein A2W98_02825 [Bacteroidetes bacterium GWF2_33_38]OFY74619.1 MAG: hypothetical protein A2265_03835 [Bacteroidetes bacterium RIFOXYA12_FULL_33_9]OFY90820.1 MAG: hypothetical protein A2236_06265 [Bacteroidetes bacterium RIFOXYA2_FULL_33_7]HBF87598.1 hypothetical protein [Bacteroidales bacterium]